MQGAELVKELPDLVSFASSLQLVAQDIRLAFRLKAMSERSESNGCGARARTWNSCSKGRRVTIALPRNLSKAFYHAHSPPCNFSGEHRTFSNSHLYYPMIRGT